MRTYFINRIFQTFSLLGMILMVLIYCVGLIIIWFLFFICGLFWKDEAQLKVSQTLFEKIPRIP